MAIRDEQNNLLGAKELGETVYEYDYYSGSQIVIMIGDIVVDAAVATQFSVENSKTPVYGYANQYYTFVAEGKVLVQGSLTVAFKESSYMLYPVQRFVNNFARIQSVSGQEEWQKNFPGLSKSPRYSLDAQGNINNTYTPEDYTLTEASNKARHKEVMRANVEQMYSWDYRGGPAGQPRLQQKYNDFWHELGALPDKDFEDYAEVFEDAIWYGSDQSNPLVRDKLFSKDIPSGEFVTKEELLKHRRLDQYPEIDIWIVYGDMTRQPANHTVKKLLDVSFVGQSQVIQIDGQPTFENFNFFARNLV
jgi:hypothetical protein